MSRLFSGTPFDRPPLCDRCGKAPADCRCMPLPKKQTMTEREAQKQPAAPPARAPGRLDSGLQLSPENARPPADQLAKVRTEKRKGNRIVTLITGLEHPANDLPKLCTELKQALGAGGSVQGRTIELQGDLGDKVEKFLTAKGLRARHL